MSLGKINIVMGNITKEKCDAIVNAANSSLLGGGGVDGAIHHAAGRKLLEECRTIGGCPTGEARITKAYNLEAKGVKWIIHTVGPIWRGGGNNEEKLLANAYSNSLRLALDNNVKVIAFPSISTGVYSYPLDKASRIAIDTIKSFLDDNDSIEEVRMVCFDEKTYEAYKNALIK